MTKLSKMLKSETPSYTMVLPITKKKITYRPFKVKEEKILLMAMEEGTEEAMLRALLRIIESCCEGIDDAGELTSIEIEHIFIKLRSKSVGEIVEPVITCPYTGEQIQPKIDLSDIYLENNKDVSNKISISDKMGITLKLPCINTIINNSFEKDFSEMGIEDSIKIISLCIEEIWTDSEIIKGDNTTTEEKIDFLENLSPDVFAKIIDFFENAPTLSYNLKYKTKDEKEREITLSGMQDFFV
ncbi:MAG: hypothetical protein H8D80_02160 [Proteobacteria bacterium]|nr:hypothetical protein [Pseudomonadota bacterium]